MLWLLLACGPGTLDVGGKPDRPRRDTPSEDTDVEVLDDTAPPDPDDTAPPDTAPPDDTGDDGPDDASAVFDLTVLHTVAITLGDAARARLAADPYTYVPADLTFDGEDYPNVGVRIKGRLGSYRTLDAKAALKVDFLEMGSTDKLHGLEKLNLNNMVQDCAKVHELAAYAIHRAMGTPAPRVAYAEVTIDGESYGLYSVVEDYDDEFLQDHFADPTGNLYDGDYHLWPNGSYTLVDFNAAGEPYFVLDEGADVAMADLHAITEAAPGGLSALVSLVDVEQHAIFAATTAWTGHSDSYTYYANNYRVYFDPSRGGRAVFLPWDPDWAFYSSTAVTSPYGVVSQICFADAGCRAQISAAIDTINGLTAPGSAIETEARAAVALIDDALDRDPRLETTRNEIRRCQADLFDWFARRDGELAAIGL